MKRPRRTGPPPSPRVEADRARPLVLVLETGSAYEAMALVQGDLCLAMDACRRPPGRGAALSQRLAAMLGIVDRVPADLRAIAAGRGPGAFAGLRSGLSMAHGLAAGLGIPIFGFSTPSAWAGAHHGLVAVTLDARRGEVYGALYESAGQWPPEEIVAPALFSPERWGERLSSCPEASVQLVGDGAVLHQDAIRTAAGRALREGPPRTSPPDLAGVGARVATWVAAGRSPEPGVVVPEYFREAVVG